MGDVAMTVPVIQAVTEKYPEVQVTVLTKKLFMPIFNGMERVQTIEADVKKRHKGLIGLWRLYQELKPLNFNAVADLHNVLRSRVLKKYFALERIPIEQIDKGRKEKKALTRSKNKVFQQLKSTHQRYADVFTQLGFPIELSKAKPLARIQLSEKVLGLVQQDTKKWVGIAPFAAHEGKMYPLEHTEEVIKELNNTNKYKILLFGGGAKEVELLEELASTYENALNMAGKLILSEELQLISNLDVMLSMDSGNSHLATNYGIPVVTLWGVTHPFAGFYSFNQPLENALLADREKYPLIPTSIYGNKVPEGYENAMKTIEPKKVVEKLLSILEPIVD
ncbi:DNA phosphorothioation-dependent restriction protein DptG [Flagellimonas zhangzhouensis]|uniref:DNA phosphorothioation-dependent restriction protein DptG n=2 Tax=Flagellimonas zhangzhouensis TaxID=1073328 RepID=A0A1H2UQ20_9FLAO|nr:DNA phosphorothioation-dependent restriction protein DptG [Allomuricauda zhangzhouensis]SDW58237.1 DNA phosphorothioation-dependent restriction protein DptG [Allomuricauda zhangzhouensis]